MWVTQKTQTSLGREGTAAQGNMAEGITSVGFLIQDLWDVRGSEYIPALPPSRDQSSSQSCLPSIPTHYLPSDQPSVCHPPCIHLSFPPSLHPSLRLSLPFTYLTSSYLFILRLHTCSPSAILPTDASLFQACSGYCDLEMSQCSPDLWGHPLCIGDRFR